MSLILASLFSRKSSSAGLMVYDPDSSNTRYLQLVDFSGLPVRVHQIRGISLAGDRLYALVPCAMLIFRVTARKMGPVFALEKTICRPEWILGDDEQGDLHAVYASQKQRRVYLSFNAQCAIDVFDLNGDFLQRRNLWDIAPNLFSMPSGPTDKNFRFGVVRHIFESEQEELLLTTALMNEREDSAVINYDTGRILLGKAPEPIHGGVLHRKILYLCAIRKGAVLGYDWPQVRSTSTVEPLRKFYPRVANHKWELSAQKTRGLAVNNDQLLCGVCYFGKPKPTQVPPRIVEFDLKSGKQTKEHWLPSFQGFEEPHIYALFPASSEVEQAVALRDELAIYKGESRLSPVWTGLNESAGKRKIKSEYDILKRIESEKSQKEVTPPIETKSKFDTVKTSEDKPPKPPTIIFENVGLCFERAAWKFLSFNKNLRKKKYFWALRDVSFTIREGETLGIIGRNGSGKSTLSMICSGVLIPDKGKVTIHGRPQLLALGVGFQTALSGRENVFISGSLLGLSKKEIKDRMDEIEEFAELGGFMDEPVRIYSSGMRSRLGFAVATAVKPDILILDEVMATGDKAFRDKAMQRMRAMRNLARSIIVVSHNPGQLRKLSTRVLWLEKGQMIMLGEPKEVLNAYNNFCKSPAKWFRNHPDLHRKVASREIVDD